MANLLRVTEKIHPLIAVTIKLVSGADLANKLVLILTHCEAADRLKILGDDMKALEKQILQVKAKVGELVNQTKGRGFKKLLRE